MSYFAFLVEPLGESNVKKTNVKKTNVKKSSWTAAALFLLLVGGFQNCGDTQLQTLSKSSGSSANQNNSDYAALPLDNENNGVGVSTGNSPGGATSPAGTGCSAGTFNWSIGGNTCSASVSGLANGSGQSLVDNSSPTTGRASVRCDSSTLVLLAGGTCVSTSTTNPPSVPTARLYNGHSSTYYLSESRVFAYTGATVSDSVAACIQRQGDGSYPCINGNVAPNFRMVPRPASPTSPTQELVWSSDSFFAIAGFDFADYDIIFRKVNADGSLGAQTGKVVARTRLVEDVAGQYPSAIVNGQIVPARFASSGGSNVVYSICNIPNVGTSPFRVPAGYKPYGYFSSKECYYMIGN
jgi:hypothetical protein